MISKLFHPDAATDCRRSRDSSPAVVLICFFLFCGFAFLSTGGTENTPTAIKIGAVFNLSGGLEELGIPASNGALLAVREINRQGGILNHPLELVLRDSNSDIQKVRNVTDELIHRDHVITVIGLTDSDMLLAAAPPAQIAGIPFITVGATSPLLPHQIGNRLFLACFGDNVQAAAAAEYALKHFGRSSYLLWDESQVYTKLLAKYFREQYTKLGGTILIEDQYQDQTKNFEPQISKLKSLKKVPDFYFISAMPYNVAKVVQEFRAAGINGPIVGGDGYDTPDLLQIAGKAANNVYFTTHAFMSPEAGTAMQQFMAAYQKEFADAPKNSFAALGYDTVYLLADALKRAGVIDSDAVQKALEDTKHFQGVTGDISFTHENHIPLKSVAVIGIKQGKLHLAEEVLPESVPVP